MPVINYDDFIKSDYVYDLEVYPNIFTMTIADGLRKKAWQFEISDRKDESELMRKCLARLYKTGSTMIGFNNLGFDYPVLHFWLKSKGASYRDIYDYAMEVISANEFEKFKYLVPVNKQVIRQVDLFKINHFDNKAKRTSLKIIEFNNLSDNIEDLPFPVGKVLTDTEKDVLLKYNLHDVKETYKFFTQCAEAMELRASLSEKYGRDFTNHNDTKIGKDYFVMRLEEQNPDACYVTDDKTGKKKPRQTKRKKIALADVIFPYIEFERPEFKAVLEWFKQQVITETKGVFTDIEEHNLGELRKYCKMLTKSKKLPDNKVTDEEVLKLLELTKLRGKQKPEQSVLDEIWEKSIKAKAPTTEQVEILKKEKPYCWIEEKRLKAGKDKVSFMHNWRIAETLNTVVDRFQYDFGVGGIHGSVGGVVIEEDDDFELIDADVASYYPNLFIKNKLFPEHLGELFCDIYEDVYNQRKQFGKKTPENKMMKLALNGTYGATNDVHSPFYDPKVTMAITVNGQLLLCMLAEKLIKESKAELIAINTDGLTVKIPRKLRAEYDRVCKEWMEKTKLELEFVNYKMYAANSVNHYIAVTTDGSTKCKGAYVYNRKDLGHHQDQGGLIIKEAAVKEIVQGIPAAETIRKHTNKYDFLFRTKVPRSSRLVSVDNAGNEFEEQNVCRYYVSTKGRSLVKIMPPLEKEPDKERRIGIAAGRSVRTCNNIKVFEWDVDYDFYINEAQKLVNGVKSPELNLGEGEEDDN